MVRWRTCEGWHPQHSTLAFQDEVLLVDRGRPLLFHLHQIHHTPEQNGESNSAFCVVYLAVGGQVVNGIEFIRDGLSPFHSEKLVRVISS